MQWLLLLLICFAQAATVGNVAISGTVPATVAIVVTPLSGYNSLDLSTTVSDLGVATVRERSNIINGYTITLASTNSGLLKNGVLDSKVYTAKYATVPVTLSSTPVVITTQGTQTSAVNILKTISISYLSSEPESLMEGGYSDTLTFTIIAN